MLALLDGIKVALKSKFAVLIDKDDIPTGDDWRRVLNTWVGDCHAAVLLLSDRALQRPWVAYEAAILRFRQIHRSCRLVLVFLESVNEEALQKSLLSPAALDATQAIRAASHAEIIQRIDAVLEGLALDKTPIDGQCEYIKDKLGRSLTEPLANDFAAKLQFDLGDWKSDPYRDLSLALIGEKDLLRVASVLSDLRGHINNEREFQNLFEIAASSWVDTFAAQTFKNVATNADPEKRTVSVGAIRPLIAECYVRRAAADRPPLDSWITTSIDGVFADDPKTTLETQVRHALLARLRLSNDEQLSKKLRAKDLIREPIVVALPGEGLDRPVLNHLRAKFPTITFFALAGQDAATRETLRRSGVLSLAPDLTESFEDSFCDAYEDAREALDFAERKI